MRPIDVILILLSVIIIMLAGFGPLFSSHDRHDRIRAECEMFYGPSGAAAVTRCVTEMTARAGNLDR